MSVLVLGNNIMFMFPSFAGLSMTTHCCLCTIAILGTTILTRYTLSVGLSHTHMQVAGN